MVDKLESSTLLVDRVLGWLEQEVTEDKRGIVYFYLAQSMFAWKTLIYSAPSHEPEWSYNKLDKLKEEIIRSCQANQYLMNSLAELDRKPMAQSGCYAGSSVAMAENKLVVTVSRTRRPSSIYGQSSSPTACPSPSLTSSPYSRCTTSSNPRPTLRGSTLKSTNSTQYAKWVEKRTKQKVTRRRRGCTTQGSSINGEDSPDSRTEVDFRRGSLTTESTDFSIDKLPQQAFNQILPPRTSHRRSARNKKASTAKKSPLKTGPKIHLKASSTTEPGESDKDNLPIVQISMEDSRESNSNLQKEKATEESCSGTSQANRTETKYGTTKHVRLDI